MKNNESMGNDNDKKKTRPEKEKGKIVWSC